jgi:hypothetical protein
MSTTRRGFLAGILASGFAPAAIGSGILMPVKQLLLPPQKIVPAEVTMIAAGLRRGDVFTIFGVDGAFVVKDIKGGVASLSPWSKAC